MADMGLRELERIRLILRGSSVIDWRRMHFQSRNEVDRFLRLCQIDTTRPEDELWARMVLADAVDYLRQTYNYRVADAVADPAEIHDLFLYASGVKGLPRHRRIACIVLKVMHVIQHIEGRDLLHRLAISEADLSELVMAKVLSVAQLLRDKGLPVVEFAHSIKSRESLITKLLAKRETVAAQIYDRTRFRIITQTQADILPVLYFLTQHLFPFNFVVPGQTENTLVSFKAVLAENPHLQQYAQHLHLDLDYEDREERTRNLFSGGSYRALNFVVDVPLRMDAYLPPPEQDSRERKNRTVFTLVEFQIIDEETSRQNEEGENAHKLYKRRQKRRVLRRLSRGLVVPKRQG
ncbi:TIGR04552 family protein [Archangium minus]|uniref:TIGR04552 family protein n=1 Tax=Archangium minus TaxID=83450 RepID=A0ABY9WVF6_9BACT|nr:TIGR04552 family protein [Archangium minus]